MRHPDLLAAIADLEPSTSRGPSSATPRCAGEELKASAAGGRWGERRAFEVLYLGRPRDSVVVEAYRHLVDNELDDAQALAATVLECSTRRGFATLDLGGLVDGGRMQDVPDGAFPSVNLIQDHVVSDLRTRVDFRPARSTHG